MSFGKRILLLVPHPDDEVVAAAATIRRVREEGAEVMALYLTHGCIAKETRWPWDRKNHEACVARRLAEAEEAAKFLDIVPIGFSARPARHLWRALDQVYSEIITAIKTHNIDCLWVPAYEGGNADHDGLNACGYALAHALQIPTFEFAEYNNFEGRAHSQSFPFPNGTETVYRLSDEERDFKKQALKIYCSEKGNLGYVQTEQECFRPLTHSDYAKPPHEGTLWYAKFQWVPFKHPRVDFTDPSDVSKALQLFLSSR